MLHCTKKIEIFVSTTSTDEIGFRLGCIVVPLSFLKVYITHLASVVISGKPVVLSPLM